MIRSMTAFSRVSQTTRKGQWIVELRSLNHRYFDLSMRVPPDLVELEGPIRDLVKEKITRGKISLSITCSEEADEEDLQLDEAAARKYLKAVRTLKRRFGLQGDVTVEDLIKLPRLFTNKKSKESLEKSWLQVKQLLKRGVQQAVKAKEVEGGKIAQDMAMRLKAVQVAAQKIEKAAASRVQESFEKLKERVRELLGGQDGDPERLWREVALMADRSDVTEELVRLRSHLSLFQTRLRSKDEIGRELDFLCQELNREINTIGSKAQSFGISREVVFVKGEIEKIREQVQNVE